MYQTADVDYTRCLLELLATSQFRLSYFLRTMLVKHYFKKNYLLISDFENFSTLTFRLPFPLKVILKLP